MLEGLTWELRHQETVFGSWTSQVLYNEWIAFQVVGGDPKWKRAGYLVQKPELPILGEVVIRPAMYTGLREINVYQLKIYNLPYRIRFDPEPYLDAVEVLLWEVIIDPALVNPAGRFQNPNKPQK